MRDILFLAHRIPYPPDKGDKIRAWNILRHLSSRYRVHLGMFIDAAEDVRHVEPLEAVCASVFWRPLAPCLATLRSLGGLLSGRSLTQGYFGDARFAKDVDKIVARYKPGLAYVFSSAMIPYVARQHDMRLILDLVDVDSEKWRQYAQATYGPKRFIYSREGRKLLALEREGAAQADVVTFVTPAEANLFRRLAPECASRIYCVGNGVDADLFDPSLEFENPFAGRPAIVFTGVMNYRPNVDAMVWFAHHIMPRLRGLPESPCLWIVGSNPSEAVRKLSNADIRVTGRVPDTRPYLRHARVVVAPLRIARGVQNKVFEAMAMGVPLIVTPQIRETLAHCSDDEVLTAATSDEFVGAITRVLRGGMATIGARARQRVVRDYRWDSSLAVLDQLIGATLERANADAAAPALVM
jgi:sugar transferase (PEP-CTERM/EpsH1 system associated)